MTFNSAVAISQWWLGLQLLSTCKAGALELDVIGCNSIISKMAQSDSDLWKQSAAMLSSTRLMRLEPNLLSINSYAASLETNWAAAVQLEEEAKGSTVPDMITSLAVLHGLRAAGRWQRSVLVLGNMYRDLIQVGRNLCNCAVDACQSANAWLKAILLGEQPLDVMVGHGWSLRTRSVSFAATMHRMRPSGRPRGCKQSRQSVCETGKLDGANWTYGMAAATSLAS